MLNDRTPNRVSVVAMGRPSPPLRVRLARYKLACACRVPGTHSFAAGIMTLRVIRPELLAAVGAAETQPSPVDSQTLSATRSDALRAPSSASPTEHRHAPPPASAQEVCTESSIHARSRTRSCAVPIMPPQPPKLKHVPSAPLAHSGSSVRFQRESIATARVRLPPPELSAAGGSSISSGAR